MSIYFPQPLPMRCWNDPRNGFGNMSCKIRDKLQQKIRLKIQDSSRWTGENLELLINVLPFANTVIPGKSIFFTMWESTHLPPWTIHHLNNARLVIVPCRYNKEIFVNNGVSKVAVVPLGVSISIYNNKNWKKNGPCAFGVAGALYPDDRKNIPFVIKAFKKAFTGKNAILKIKTSDGLLNLRPLVNHSQIQSIDKSISESQMCNWYNSLDAFVNCAHSEGWGLMQLEAMACGVPVISPKYGGVTEFFDETIGYCVDHKIVKHDQGVWSNTIEESLIEKMMMVYNNREQAVSLGLKARERACMFTWDNTANKLIKTLNNYCFLNKIP